MTKSIQIFNSLKYLFSGKLVWKTFEISTICMKSHQKLSRMLSKFHLFEISIHFKTQLSSVPPLNIGKLKIFIQKVLESCEIDLAHQWLLLGQLILKEKIYKNITYFMISFSSYLLRSILIGLYFLNFKIYTTPPTSKSLTCRAKISIFCRIHGV